MPPFVPISARDKYADLPEENGAVRGVADAWNRVVPAVPAPIATPLARYQGHAKPWQTCYSDGTKMTLIDELRAAIAHLRGTFDGDCTVSPCEQHPG